MSKIVVFPGLFGKEHFLKKQANNSLRQANEGKGKNGTGNKYAQL